MEECPKCHRLSLDYDPFTKRRRCLYLTVCGYSEELPNRVSGSPKSFGGRSLQQPGFEMKRQPRY